MRKYSILLIGALIAGCAAPEIQQANNPFANDRQGSPVHKLSLALVLPTLSIVKNGAKVQSAALTQKNGEEPETTYRDILGIYYQHFKSVTVVKSLSDPRVASADIIGSVDINLVPNPPDMTWTTSFYGPDHGLVTAVKAEASSSGSLFGTSPETAFSTVIPLVPDQLDQQLLNSAELKQYAKTVEAKQGGQTQSDLAGSRKAKAFDSDVDRPGYSFDENSENFAVVIGVENYQNLPPAEFAGRDAQAVRAHLRALGYPGQNVIMLTDAQATGNAIRSYVESWLPRNVKEDSKVFFYFSGHGAPDADSKQAYLVPWDGDAQYLTDTGYPLKRLYARLNGLKAKQVIVAMDSCFSGAGGHSVLAKGARPLMTHVDQGSSEDLGKVVVLAAAGAEEITGEEESQGHGLFTYYLLKGLNDSQGKNTVGGIYGFLKPKVEGAARQSNRGQTPQLMAASADAGGAESLR